MIALPTGGVIRASDGKMIHVGKDAGAQAVASPVVEGGEIFTVPSSSSTLIMAKLPDVMADPLAVTIRKVAFDTKAFPYHYLPWHLCSPVIHDGLAYLVNNAGVLTVIDVRAGQVVYQKMLDLDVFQAHNEGAARGVGISLALAGKYLYCFGNNGAGVVLEPGRSYKQVAKNKIENVVMAGHWAERQERFMANPVFDGQRMCLRGEGGLWAIGR